MARDKGLRLLRFSSRFRVAEPLGVHMQQGFRGSGLRGSGFESWMQKGFRV